MPWARSASTPRCRATRDPDRSLLRRTDHHLHLPAHRQRRHQPRGHRDHDSGRARPDPAPADHRPGQLALRAAPGALARQPQPRGHRRRRHPQADPAHPRPRRPGGRRLPRPRRPLRPRRAGPRGQRLAGAGRHGPRGRGLLPAELQVGRDPLGLGPGLRHRRGASPAILAITTVCSGLVSYASTSPMTTRVIATLPRIACAARSRLVCRPPSSSWRRACWPVASPRRWRAAYAARCSSPRLLPLCGRRTLAYRQSDAGDLLCAAVWAH